jgi:methyl-accepting chemotaxis protein
MHVVEAADEDSQPVPIWEGITGRMKQLLWATNDRVEAVASKVEAVASQVEQVNTHNAHLTERMDEMTKRMDQMTGRMDEMVHGQGQIKDLLQTMMAQAQ